MASGLETIAVKINNVTMEELFPKKTFATHLFSTVIATAGLVTVRFLIRYTHSNRLIPAKISNMESKSREIRRACCEFLELILRLWPAHTLEKQVANLQQALRKGMYDADSEARQCSRRAFWHFRLHFHENAEQILNSLDSTHKKALNLEMGMSNSNNIADQQGGRGGRLAAGSDFPRGRTVAAPSAASCFLPHMVHVFRVDSFQTSLCELAAFHLTVSDKYSDVICFIYQMSDDPLSSILIISFSVESSSLPKSSLLGVYCKYDCHLRELNCMTLGSDMLHHCLSQLSQPICVECCQIPDMNKVLTIFHTLNIPETLESYRTQKLQLDVIQNQKIDSEHPKLYVSSTVHSDIVFFLVGVSLLCDSLNVILADGNQETFHLSRKALNGSPRRGSAPGPSALRSNSAIDLQAAQRAKARAQYAALARHKVGSGASLPRPGKKAADSSGMSTSVITSPERLGRTRSRMSNVSQSQPTSRSGSPSSRLSYATFSTTNRETGHDGRQCRPSGIPLSTGPSREASRETSPSRYSLNLLDRSFGSKLRGRSGHIGNVSDRQGQSRPVMAQKILQQSREAESALADALTFDSVDGNEVGSRVPLSRKAYRSFDDHSDDSETSSVCSERSLDCYRRSGDMFCSNNEMVCNLQTRRICDRLLEVYANLTEILSFHYNEQFLSLECDPPTHYFHAPMCQACCSIKAYQKSNLFLFLEYLGRSELRVSPFGTQCHETLNRVVSFIITHYHYTTSSVTAINHYCFEEPSSMAHSFFKSIDDATTLSVTILKFDRNNKKDPFEYTCAVLSQVFSMFLDTLNELILAHKDDLHDWIYILLTRLMNKLGGDLLGSIQNKIHKSLSIVRESFPLELQMNAIIRFLVDQTQTPNSKVKVAVLQYLAQLASYMDASSFNPGAREAAAALAKVISWTNDQKSAEIRKAAQNALIALFNLNTPQVTMILSSLSPDYQETAASLVNSHVRRSSTGSSPPSPSPHVQSPATPQSRPSLEMDEGSLNPEEVYRSLHRTTTEIQNYSFDGGLSSVKMLDKERETTSHDSGISQMSCGMEKLEEQMEHLLSISREPTNLDGQDSDQDYKNMPSAALVEENCQIVQNVIDTLKVDDEGNAKVSEQDSKKALSQLKHLIKSGAVGIIVYNFKVLLRVLVSQLALPHSPVKTYILNVLHDIIKDPTVRHCFNMYVELIVLRTLTAYSDPCKEVSKAAEHCISAIGKSLPPEQLINVVCPLIKTGDLPMNLGAIKILTRVIEHTTQDILEPHLKEIMESLVKAYDNEESSVRKSAVFCMVELHGIVGEAVLQPHLASLNNSKLKLLHLYIKRSHHGGSSGITSPKTTTS
ncbi:CLIP-associating protein 2-like [Schistocerca serialis cubense]|uniref:CLIP-associating protein 2-like n=1 Tax=Schistocerca serialis cubense TaxID=2023355 RepID=UPI00214E25D6|nr:CLIP-associating protein 2-like [Schistocerca serialis cubense]